MKWRVLGVLFLCLSFLGLQSLNAQTAGTGALAGTIKDPSGAVVPNATVTATSADTGAVRTTMTAADGSYRFSLLPPGNYRVKIDAMGFKPLEVPSVAVAVTETAELDRNLEVGAQAQTVTVEGEAVAVQTENSTLGTVVNSQAVINLPLNTRNYTNLLAYSAGVSANVSNATTIGKGATNMAVNGGSTGQNTYMMDGVVVNNWAALGGVTEGTLPGTFAMPNPDAISEFKIQTSMYDAGYGRNPGANVNVITKSGTNDFHGTAFEFFRNSALNANDWFYLHNGIAKPPLNSNQYGGAVGGPVIKNKLFFFVNYQETDQKNGFASYSSSSTILPPIPLGNRGTCNGGNPGWYNISACDAAGTAFVQALAANMAASNPHAKGSIGIQPDSTTGLFNMNPIAISLLQLKLPNGNYYVPSSGTSGFGPTTFENPATFRDHQGVGNVDYVINSKNTFSGRYIYETDPLNANFPAVNALEPGVAVPGSPVSTDKVNQDAVAKLTTVISNNVVNEIHIGYQRNVTVNTESVLFHNTALGIQDFVSPFTPGAAVDNLSYFVIGSPGPQFAFGTHPFFGSHENENQFILGDQVSWTRGKHTFRAGGDIERVQLASVSGTGSVGMPTFQTFADFLVGRQGLCGPAVAPSAANPAGCNGGSASNVASTGGTTSANPFAQVNAREFAPSLFLQDDIKLTPRFTLNLGLRWEQDNWPTDADGGGFSSFWPSLATAAATPLVGVPGGPGESLAGYVVPSNFTGAVPPGVYQNALPYYTQTHAPWGDFSPRLGFAWQPTSSNKLVIRGGGGFFYDLISGQYTGSFGRSNPVFGPPAQGSPTGSLSNPWAQPPGIVGIGPGYFGFAPRWVDVSTVCNPGNNFCGTGNPVQACTKPPCSSNITPQAWQQNLTVPVTYQWNMNVQYEFLPSWVLELGYVGSHGIHQASPGAVNGPTADGSPISTPYNPAQLVEGPCPSCAALGIASDTTQNAILRVPYLGISPNAQELQTNANYKFNSLQVTVRHQFAHGFQMQAAYSWSRGFEQDPVGVNTYPYVIDAYSPEYFVRPQRLIVNYVWNLPVPKMTGFAGRLLDDWSWSGVVTIQNGEPIDIVDSNGGNIFGFNGGVLGNIAPAQLCPGMTAANILTGGSTVQKVTSGLAGGDGWLNSAAFCPTPTIGNGNGFGNMAMAFSNVLGPGEANWDMSLAKQFKIREAQSLEFRAEIYNTFNHPMFNVPNDNDVADALVGGVVGSGNGFGQITTSAVNPRVMQFALKFLF
jgi:hypothetical protein